MLVLKWRIVTYDIKRWYKCIKSRFTQNKKFVSNRQWRLGLYATEQNPNLHFTNWTLKTLFNDRLVHFITACFSNKFFASKFQCDNAVECEMRPAKCQKLVITWSRTTDPGISLCSLYALAMCESKLLTLPTAGVRTTCAPRARRTSTCNVQQKVSLKNCLFHSKTCTPTRQSLHHFLHPPLCLGLLLVELTTHQWRFF